MLLELILFGLLVGWEILNQIDFNQMHTTIDLGGWEENWIIGKYPSDRKIEDYRWLFASIYFLLIVIGYFTNPIYTLVFAGITTVYKGWVVFKNSKVIKRLRGE